MAVSPGVRDEIRRLARETDLPAAEIARRLGVRYERVRIDVGQVRREQRVTSAEHAPAKMAQRILALLGAELERIEKAQRGRLDLDVSTGSPGRSGRWSRSAEGARAPVGPAVAGRRA